MDVALIQWPTDETLRAELEQVRQPRLLLVASDAEPPHCIDTLEDWVRLPVSRTDRLARIRALESRAAHEEGARPVMDGSGTLRYGDCQIQLSELQVRVLTPMIDRFGSVVGRDILTAHGWPNRDVPDNKLDVTMSRARRQIAPIGLTLRAVRSRGYLLGVPEPPD